MIFKFATGLAIGYVLGSRAGRDKYEQIAAATRKAQDHPTVRQAQQKARELLGTIGTTTGATTGTTTATSDPVPAETPTTTTSASRPSAPPSLGASSPGTGGSRGRAARRGTSAPTPPST